MGNYLRFRPVVPRFHAISQFCSTDRKPYQSHINTRQFSSIIHPGNALSRLDISLWSIAPPAALPDPHEVRASRSRKAETCREAEALMRSHRSRCAIAGFYPHPDPLPAREREEREPYPNPTADVETRSVSIRVR